MDQETALATLKHYLYTSDRHAAHEIYHEDAVLEFPQSGERFDGVENFRHWRAEYPAKVEFELDRIQGRDDLWIAEVRVRYNQGPWGYGVSILEFRGQGGPRDHLRRRGVGGAAVASAVSSCAAARAGQGAGRLDDDGS